MKPRIHPSALIDPKAEIAGDVQVGPWVIVGPGCEVGAGSVLQARATLEENVHIGERVTIGSSSIIGGPPQDLKFGGEITFVEIGDDTAVREFVTVNRGTSESRRTTVGKHCFLMSYSHVAHDCHVGDHVILSNGVQLGGHVTVGEHAVVGGLCAAHQFSKIGRHAFIGGCSRITKDVPPFVRAVGNPIKLYGLNSVGLKRRDFSDEVVLELKKAYRLLFRSELNLSQAIEQVARELKPFPEVQDLCAFVEASARGVAV